MKSKTLLFVTCLLSVSALIGGVGYSLYLSRYSKDLYVNGKLSEAEPFKRYNSALKFQASGELEKAEEYYESAIRPEEDDKVTLKSLFNLGILLAQKAEDASADNLDRKLSSLKKAAEAYKALLLNRDEMDGAFLNDSEYNFEKIRSRINRLEALAAEKKLKKLNEKSPYALVLEIEETEKEILEKVKAFRNERDPFKRNELFEEIIALRTENYDFLKALYKKLNIEFKEQNFQIHSYSI